MSKDNASSHALVFLYISLQITAKQQRQINDQIIGFVDNMKT